MSLWSGEAPWLSRCSTVETWRGWRRSDAGRVAREITQRTAIGEPLHGVSEVPQDHVNVSKKPKETR